MLPQVEAAGRQNTAGKTESSQQACAVGCKQSAYSTPSTSSARTHGSLDSLDSTSGSSHDGSQRTTLTLLSRITFTLQPPHPRTRHTTPPLSPEQILSHVRFGLVSAETLAGAVESHPLLQSRAGRAFVHEAYRYQALPPESRDDLLASSMEARARPRAAAAAAAGPAGARAARSSSFATASRAPSGRRGRPSWGGGFAGGLGGVNFADEESGSSCDEGGERGTGRDGCRDAGLEEESGDPATSGSESGGGGSGGRAWEDARAAPAPASDGAEGMRVVVAGGGDGNDHGEVEDTDAPSKAGASPSRRSWGAGLRMYV